MFGDLKVHLDAWQPEYGPEFVVDLAIDEADEETRLDVELDPSMWRPLRPEGPPLKYRLAFVDGVRRIDARILVQSTERMVYGAFGSYAIGHVEANGTACHFSSERVDRVAVLAAGLSFPTEIPVAPALAYRPSSAAGEDADAPVKGIENEMRLAEEALARDLANRGDLLVVADGPLHFADPVRGAAIGYIKRLWRLYLPEALVAILPRLMIGERTPLFALRSSRRFARYAWFLRIAPQMPGDSPLSGIVRMEVSEVVGAEAARRLADGTALALPRFAPDRGRDPRAPQNLAPIGALERRLRHIMGDPVLLRRHIETLIRLEARHG